MIIHYRNVQALRAAYVAIKSPCYSSRTSGDWWFDGETDADTLRMSDTGDTRLVPTAQALMDKLDHAVSTPRRMWDRSPAGAFCVVPDVLAGLPTPMRRQVFTADERAPIAIYAVTGSSGGINASHLAKRGTTILALVMALARVRPISLFQLDFSGGRKDGETIICTQINTTPLDLATACYAMTSSGFARRLVYSVMEEANGHSGAWPPGYYGNPEPYLRGVHQKLGLDPKYTLMIDAARLHDTLLVDPIKWLNDQVRRFTANAEEQAA
jgi:hypothetical protein